MASAPAAPTARTRPAMGMTCAVVAAVGLLATGCSAELTGGDTDMALPDIAAEPAAPATGYDGLTGLPLSAYGTSQQEDILLFRTNEALVARCMNSLGYKNYPGRKKTQADTKTQAEREAIRPAGGWGYIGGGTAKRLGFHVAITPPVSKGPTGRELKDYNVCWDKADKQVPSPTGSKGWKLTQDLFGRSFQKAASDSRVVAARKSWSSCMGEAGHPADDPQKLSEGFMSAKKTTPKEIAAATADETCTRSSNLAGVYFAVLTGYQKQLIAANTKVLTGYKKQLQEQVDRAKQLLATSEKA